MSAPLDQHQALAEALQALREERLDTHDLCRLARAQPDLRAALPPRFGEVLDGLLDRLESSALFAGESCSFSQHDLLDSLQLWLDKAAERLR